MLQYVPSEKTLADIKTDGLGGRAHNKLEKLGGINMGACETIVEEECPVIQLCIST